MCARAPANARAHTDASDTQASAPTQRRTPKRTHQLAHARMNNGHTPTRTHARAQPQAWTDASSGPRNAQQALRSTNAVRAARYTLRCYKMHISDPTASTQQQYATRKTNTDNEHHAYCILHPASCSMFRVSCEHVCGVVRVCMCAGSFQCAH
jgi:hypothetical protein